MGVVNMVENIKLIHKDDIVLVKVGTFYHAYGKDAYIISYLFKYKIKKTKGVPTCGFPLGSINKVTANLEHKKINYVLVDRRNNYDVDDTSDNGNLNKYEEFYHIAKNQISKQIRIHNITQFLQENVDSPNFKEILFEMEKIIVNERRKVSSN